MAGQINSRGPKRTTPSDLETLSRLAAGERVGDIAYAYGVKFGSMSMAIQRMRTRMGVRTNEEMMYVWAKHPECIDERGHCLSGWNKRCASCGPVCECSNGADVQEINDREGFSACC
jgi:hypothetical protein